MSVVKSPRAVTDASIFIDNVAGREIAILEQLQVEKRLDKSVAATGLTSFANAFYFIRVNFVHHNFVLGARCPTHELYWGGLAHNLMEEVGGESGPAHNELYRWFLQEVGAPDENSLRRPAFAADFDNKWENFVQHAVLEEALGAIAVYEILDNPDYQMLLAVMSKAEVSPRGLAFFQVHAKAAHFELFEDYFHYISGQSGGIDCLQRATDFVFQAQKEMWSGLLEYLESRCESK